MAVHVIIKRKWQVDKPEALIPLLSGTTLAGKRTTRIYFQRNIAKHRRSRIFPGY